MKDPAALAAEEAERLLPCTGHVQIGNVDRRCERFLGTDQHLEDCAVRLRPKIAAALLAAEQRGREQVSQGGIGETFTRAVKIAAAIDRAVQEEREACASLAERYQKRHDERCNPACRCSDGNHVAAAIRARGNQ